MSLDERAANLADRKRSFQSAAGDLVLGQPFRTGDYPPNKPIVITTRPSEPEAALIVAALAQQGIDAQATGGLTSALRAEAPGVVSIQVRQSDLERAQSILAELEGDR